VAKAKVNVKVKVTAEVVVEVVAGAKWSSSLVSVNPSRH
jgi:hypothetical protein